MQASYDAIVVGSGFGGGIAACRLAEAGRRVCVLERGRRFGRDDFPDRPGAGAARCSGTRRPTRAGCSTCGSCATSSSSPRRASAAARSSTRTSSCARRPPSSTTRAGRRRSTRATLEPWYARTEDALQPRTTPAEPRAAQGRARSPPRARRAGREAEPLPIAVHFGEPREHPFSGVPQEGCQNLAAATSAAPCTRRTRSTSPTSRAPRRTAPRSSRCTRSRRLEPPGRGGGRAGASASATCDGGGTARSSAPLVVLAAGTLGSPRLLLTNRRRLPRPVARARHAASPATATRSASRSTRTRADVRGARNDYRAGDDERARLHRRAAADRSPTAGCRRTSAACWTSPAAST